MLKGKTILLGVTGGIAAYKSANLASLLVKQAADVHVLMTENACEFISPMTFETLTGNKCLVNTFDRNFQFQVEHVSLAKRADAFIIAPATANTIAKIAHGIADNMLTTTFLACTCPKIIAPAMNSAMYQISITQDNINKLVENEMNVITPDSGRLACGDVGVGKMPEPEVLLSHILRTCAFEKDLVGKHILVTAGPTKEALDPVRFITNHSTGTMGYSLAKICMLRGANVTLVTGETNLTPPPFVRTVEVQSAQEMFDAVTKRSAKMDIIIKAAAVADYRPIDIGKEKLKKSDDELTLPLERTEDILAYLGRNKQKGQFLCGFAMETKDMLKNAKKKLEEKNLDMIVANNLKVQGAGFGKDSNVVTLLTPQMEIPLPKMDKEQVATRIIDEILKELLTNA